MKTNYDTVRIPMAQKNVHGFLNEIEKPEVFDNLRKLVRLIYMYGADAPQDIFEADLGNMSSSTINNHITRLTNYMDGHDVKGNPLLVKGTLPNRKTNRKNPRFGSDTLHTGFNYLASIFHQHTISVPHFIMLFYLLGVLYPFDCSFDACNRISPYEDIPESLLEDFAPTEDPFDNPFKKNEVFSALSLYDAIAPLFESNTHILQFLNGLPYSSQVLPPFTEYQVDSFLKLLTEVGILETTEPSEGAVCYRFSDSVFKDELFYQNADNLLDLYYYLNFSYNTAAISLPLYDLAQKTGLLLEDTDSSVTPFHFENANYQNIIDDDVTWQIVCAIDSAEILSYQYQPGNDSTNQDFSLLPIKVINDLYYGRHYVFGWNYTNKGYVLHRIDRIFGLTISTVPPEKKYSFLPKVSQETPSKVLDEVFHLWMENTYSVDGSFHAPQLVTIFFSFPDTPHGKVDEHRFLATKRFGIVTVSEEKAHNYTYSIYVKNPAELIPWINSFGDCAVVDSAASPSFYQTMYENTQETLRLYESV